MCDWCVCTADKRLCSIPVLSMPWGVQGMFSQHCQVFLPGPAVHFAFAFPPALLLSLDTASHSVWMLRKQQPWNLQNLQEAMPRFVLQLTGFGSSKFPEGCGVVCTRARIWSVINQGEFFWGYQGLLLSDYFGRGQFFYFCTIPVLHTDVPCSGSLWEDFAVCGHDSKSTGVGKVWETTSPSELFLLCFIFPKLQMFSCSSPCLFLWICCIHASVWKGFELNWL